jgi:hypothetical protein
MLTAIIGQKFGDCFGGQAAPFTADDKTVLIVLGIVQKEPAPHADQQASQAIHITTRTL